MMHAKHNNKIDFIYNFTKNKIIIFAAGAAFLEEIPYLLPILMTMLLWQQ